jgi:hypothetical protein
MRRWIVVLMALPLLAAACGGNSAETSAPVAPTDVASVDPGGGGGAGAAGLTNADCIQVGLALAQAGSMGAGMTGDGSVEDSAQALENMSKEAPAEIADDLQVLGEGLAAFGQALKDAGIDLSDPQAMADPGAQQALSDAVDAFDASGASEASQNISTYVEETCKT